MTPAVASGIGSRRAEVVASRLPKRVRILFHDVDQNRNHYDRVVRDKPSLFYERFDSGILADRPIVRELLEATFAARFPERVGRMLDLGCGTGFYFPLLSRHARELVGADVSGSMLRVARHVITRDGLEGCHVVRSSATGLAFADQSFDAVHSWDFLHHVSDVAGTVSEIDRVLKPGGRYVAFEPNLINPSILWYHLRRRSEWRLFTQNQFSIPRALAGRFDVDVGYDNTIISFLSARTHGLWRAVDRLTATPGLSRLSFRYTLDATKRG